MENSLTDIQKAVDTIKSAIVQSQARAMRAINEEQLSLYYGIGRYVSENTRGKWGAGAIDQISALLKTEMPGLKGFSARNLKVMRGFYEAWNSIEPNSAVATAELQPIDIKNNTIIPLKFSNFDDFPITAFLGISFTHHTLILQKVKDFDARLFYIKLAYEQHLSVDDLECKILAKTYENKDALANNFASTIPDLRLAIKTIKTFKDEYLLDFINAEDISESDPMDVDERVIENSIVMNLKNFIMTFGKHFTYKGHQVHYEKLSHDHWVDLLFFNRELKSLVVVELKKGDFKPAYLGQLSAYLRILDDDEKLAGENPSVGIILCKKADKAYVEYVLQDYRKPMGVATYKTLQKKLQEVLPPEEDMKRLLGD